MFGSPTHSIYLFIFSCCCCFGVAPRKRCGHLKMLKAKHGYAIITSSITPRRSYNGNCRPLKKTVTMLKSSSCTTNYCRTHLNRGSSDLNTFSHFPSRSNALLCSRMRLTTASDSAPQSRVMSSNDQQLSETISPEMIEVECITVETSGGEVDPHNIGVGASTTSSDSKVSRSGGVEGFTDSNSSSWSKGKAGEAFWNVQKVDPFSRGRVINYLRRMGFKGTGSPFKIKATPVAGGQQVEVNDLHHITTTTVLYTATLRVPLPAPHGSYVAEGIGETIKDAELLAAMHAERVCDALGVPLFRLPSMQQKYAENVRRTEGRYAPLPGDPMRPEGSPVPPPLRMVSAAIEKEQEKECESSLARTSVIQSTSCGTGGSLFSFGIAEAEIVDERRSIKFGATRSVGSKHSAQFPASTYEGSTSSVPPSPTPESSTEWVTEYRQSMVFPWGKSASISRSSNNSACSTKGSFPSAAPSAFDPTEGGCWQMVNIISHRRPPTAEALALPCVLDVEAMERLKDNFLQRGVGKRLEDCFTLTHVVLPGSASRMYVAELDLQLRTGSSLGSVESSNQQRFASLQAMGKAQNKDVAKQLAAMHAELLLDALGEPLFPTDNVRQSCHAAAAAKFGRWAIDPTAPDYTEQKNLLQARLVDMVLPLPLKQLVGGEEVWLDPSAPHLHQAYERTEGERVVAAQNELNFLCSDALEVYPPQNLLDDAVQLLRRWQLQVAQNPYPECFILTKMGDFYRAATITPVPRVFGVRGGIAIARTPAQAVGLCALHAVDSLCALGIPVFTNEAEQSAFMVRRSKMGLPTPDLFLGRLHPRDWEPLEPAIWHEEEFAVHTRNLMEEGEGYCKDSILKETEGIRSSVKDSPPLSLSPIMLWWKYLMQAITHRTAPGYAVPPSSPNITSGNNKNTQNKRPVLLPPYLPAYLMEGNQPRRLPHAADTRTVLQLAVLRDFDEFGKSCSEEELIHIGNEVKVCVHNYIKHQYALAGETESSGWDISTPRPLVPSVCITGYGRTGASVHNIAYLRLPRPVKKQATPDAPELAVSCKTTPSRKVKRLTQMNSTMAQSTKEVHTEKAGKCIPVVGDSSSEAGKPELESPAISDSYVPLAVGISLKKKDAERACYLHAASILYYVYGEDVMAKHRAGLPRLSLVGSFDTLLEKCFKGLYTDRGINGSTIPPSTNTWGDSVSQRREECQHAETKCDVNQEMVPLSPPKPLIHTTMKTFVSAGRYVSAQKAKRSPF